MLLSPSPFGSRSAIRPRNLPPSPSRLHRGYNRAPRGALGALDVPPPAGLDRCLLALVCDLAVQAAVGQQGAGLGRVVAGVEVHGDLCGQRASPVSPFRGGSSSGESWRWAPARTRPSGIPPPSTSTDRFNPCLRRSTGDGPAHSPPPGAFVMHPSTAR